ncbi:hypothetical protein GE09DRAFT_149537 [Coniochaeta sp. 2T2.1]|nr:hypothetical protein GE09DRAFT_149537 [Coniochaeta sp. 2T2.1]
MRACIAASAPHHHHHRQILNWSCVNWFRHGSYRPSSVRVSLVHGVTAARIATPYDTYLTRGLIHEPRPQCLQAVCPRPELDGPNQDHGGEIMEHFLLTLESPRSGAPTNSTTGSGWSGAAHPVTFLFLAPAWGSWRGSDLTQLARDVERDRPRDGGHVPRRRLFFAVACIKLSENLVKQLADDVLQGVRDQPYSLDWSSNCVLYCW